MTPRCQRDDARTIEPPGVFGVRLAVPRGVAGRMAVCWSGEETRCMGKTVLIVDDHPSFRASARRMLEADGYVVVGEAEDGGGALAAALRLLPELVLLDVRLPDVDGFDVARSLLAVPGRAPQ